MRKILAFSLALVPASLSAVQAQSSPQVNWFKDLKVLSNVAVADNGDLVFVGSDTRVHRTDARGVERWNYATGDIGRAHPIVTPQGTVIAASYDDNVYALDASGKLLWKTKLDGDVYASPALRADGSVVVATAGGSVYALGPGGQVLWTYKVGAPVFSSPAVAADGTIYFGAQDNQLHALTPGGQQKWAFRAGSLVFSSPAIDRQGNIYFGSSDRRIYSVSPEGKRRWTRETGLFVNASPIVTSGDLVVVGSYDGKVYAINTTGEDEWVYDAGAPVAAAAAELADGSVVVPDLSGTVHAIGRAGQALWKIAAGKKIDTNVAVSDQGMLYFSTEGGGLSAVQKQPPLADGPWTTFRGVPSGWGHTLTVQEAQARSAARKAAANAVLAGRPSAPPSRPAPTAQPPATKPPAPATPPAPTRTPEQYAQAAGQGARTLDGRVYLPLADVAGALGASIRLLTPRTATLALPGQAATTASVRAVPVRYVNRLPFVPLAALTGLPGVKAAAHRAPTGVVLTLAGRTLTFPLNFPALTPLRSQPEYPAVLRKPGGV